MSDLRDFVLDFYRVNGALVEPPSYGVYEVLLPDALAAQLDVPALQEIVFDEEEPATGDGRLLLAQGRPLVDRIVELARRAPMPAQAHINAVRLDKRGLAEVARQTLSFANARLVELPGQVEAAALFHYLVLTFKVTLTTDEKQEQLATVAMHAQAGWPAEWSAIHAQVALDEEPAFAHLAPARPSWLGEPHPLTPAALAGLFERAKRAVLARVASPIESLNGRAARHLELDRARLEQYYDDLVRDLERRLQRAEGERQAALHDKIAAAQAERQLKLADAEARYQLRVDLELITAQVVTQPKIELLVQIENRNTALQRRIVWDPLLHTIEPLACDVCGQPGLSLHLCSGGHLAHAECLQEEQCTDCKRVYCRLCHEQMKRCAVCGRPVCQASLNHCAACGRDTCREHVGFCHAASGAPATIAPEAKPAAQPAAPKKAREPSPARPRQAMPPARKPAAARPKAPAGPSTANWRLDVEVEWSEPEVTAFVRAGKKRTPAVRTWRLTPQGIGVICECAKADCTANHLLLRPAELQSIEAQMQAEIEDLRQEYGVPARNMSYTLFICGMPNHEPRLILRGQWKNEEMLAAARTGFDVVYAEQHGTRSTPARKAPAEPASRPLQPHETAEAQRFMEVAFGLLKFEGTIKEDELYARVHALLQPGDWCGPDVIGTLLRQHTKSFKVLANGLVATHDVSNVHALAARKKAHQLPPRQWSAEELAAVANGKQPLSELEARIEAELGQLTGIDIDVSVIQHQFQRDVAPADVVSSLEHRYGVSDRKVLQRAAELIEELYRHTPRWELGGWTPAEVEDV